MWMQGVYCEGLRCGWGRGEGVDELRTVTRSCCPREASLLAALARDHGRQVVQFKQCDNLRDRPLLPVVGAVRQDGPARATP